jgi:hypothetical protein
MARIELSPGSSAGGFRSLLELGAACSREPKMIPGVCFRVLLDIDPEQRWRVRLVD